MGFLNKVMANIKKLKPSAEFPEDATEADVLNVLEDTVDEFQESFSKLQTIQDENSLLETKLLAVETQGIESASEQKAALKKLETSLTATFDAKLKAFKDQVGSEILGIKESIQPAPEPSVDENAAPTTNLPTEMSDEVVVDAGFNMSSFNKSDNLQNLL